MTRVRYCQACKTTDHTQLMINTKRTLVDGSVSIAYMCRPCNTKRARQYREKNMHIVAAAVKRYMEKNPQRVRAWSVARYWHTEHRPCEVCGTVKADKHHPDINKPKEVVYLCRYHHKRADSGLLTSVEGGSLL